VSAFVEIADAGHDAFVLLKRLSTLEARGRRMDRLLHCNIRTRRATMDFEYAGHYGQAAGQRADI
jgi:hypothetical protein